MSNKPVLKNEQSMTPRPSQKIVTGKVHVKRNNPAKKFLGMFLAEDLDAVGDNIVQELVIPGAKRLFLDSMEMMLTGKVKSKTPNQGYVYGGGGYRYDQQYKAPSQEPQHRRRDIFDFEKIGFENRSDAEDVLSKMRVQLSEYNRVRIGDMYEYIGVDVSKTDWLYGWRDLSRAYTYLKGGMWYIHLDRPEVIE